MAFLLTCARCRRTYIMLGRTLEILADAGYGVFCQDGTPLSDQRRNDGTQTDETQA
jgi:hypothetical protein